MRLLDTLKYTLGIDILISGKLNIQQTFDPRGAGYQNFYSIRNKYNYFPGCRKSKHKTLNIHPLTVMHILNIHLPSHAVHLKSTCLVMQYT
jgi:hypothetical protein